MTKPLDQNRRRLKTLRKTAEALRNVDALDESAMRDIDAFCSITPAVTCQPT